MENIRKAVSAYNIYPVKFKQETDRLYQVDTGQQKYALKQSRMNKQALSVWEDTYRLASKHDIKSILPVYLTNHSKIYTDQNDLICYLSPWIPNKKLEEDMQSTRTIAECIAEVHAKTKKDYQVEPEPIIEKFSEYRKRCSTMQRNLLHYVEMFEQNRFMSPFELQVCTHYHLLNETFQELDWKIEQFCSELGDTAEWNYSLCHGNLKESHTLHGDQPYLINWENAFYDNATTDLIQFFNHKVRSDYQSSDKLMDFFFSYISGNPLKQQEVYLFVISSLNPRTYIQMIDAYHNRSSGDTMVYRTKELEYAFRQLKFGLYCSNWLEKHLSDGKLNGS
ncbi:phosphotransferase [Virgibacillus ihumii]|uniref:phosphotransferase n=1 Tax=Virgibacillus ihumii TaxID=2686091 RepID=UPI00157BD3D4|nr:phosphotransferase [Virgibacillus ihumii]